MGQRGDGHAACPRSSRHTDPTGVCNYSAASLGLPQAFVPAALQHNAGLQFTARTPPWCCPADCRFVRSEAVNLTVPHPGHHDLGWIFSLWVHRQRGAAIAVLILQ